MKKNIFNNYLVVSVSLFMLLLIGCSKVENIVAPSGSTITLDKTSYDWSNASPLIVIETVYFTVNVKDSDGNDLNGVDVSIWFPRAAPASGYTVQFYDGSTAVDAPFTATTDDGGNYTLRVDFFSGGGLDYGADLEFKSGSAVTTATLTVTST